jgi:hypothetical protein
MRGDIDIQSVMVLRLSASAVKNKFEIVSSSGILVALTTFVN